MSEQYSALYSSSPIVPDGNYHEVEDKLTVDVADRTLGLIEEVLEASSTNHKAEDITPTVKKTRGVATFLKRRAFTLLALLVFLALVLTGVSEYVDEVRECAVT